MGWPKRPSRLRWLLALYVVCRIAMLDVDGVRKWVMQKDPANTGGYLLFL